MLAALRLAALSLFLSAAAVAQNAPALTQQPASALELVSLVFTVTDQHGQLVKDLSKEQFQDHFVILDDDKPPKMIVSFESARSLPLHLGIVVDKSNSMREKLPPVEAALGRFAMQAIRTAGDKVFVLAFDEALHLVSDFTSDPGSLAPRINSIRPGGGSSCWDAIYFASREKLARENSPRGRLVLVVVSDADDNQSRMLRRDALEMAQSAGVTVYMISPGGEGTSGDYSAKALAEATGGRAFFPSNPRKAEEALNSIAEELAAQYYVRYEPKDLLHDGKFRPTKIQSSDKTLKVRTRKGYLTPKS